MPHQRTLVTQSQAVVAMTETERDFYMRAGSPPGAVCVAGAGVNPAEVLGGDGEAFRARHHLEGPVVALLSALAPDKGATHLVEAMRRLWDAGRQVELVLAGARLAPFQRYLDQLPASVRQRLRLLGSIAESEKRDLLAAADLVAMPSRTDSFGIVYLEAWLYGKPVVGARAWGMDDVIADGVDGVLVPFGASNRLAEVIAELLDDPARRAAMGLAGERKVHQRHTWDHVYGRVYPLYERLAVSGRTTASG
jgi:glycosyltransferase involved in cell wall biosynthesis